MAPASVVTARIVRREDAEFAGVDEGLRDVRERGGAAEEHPVAGVGFAGQGARLHADVEVRADEREVEVFFEAVEVHVPGVVLRVRVGGAVRLFVERDAVLALVDAAVFAVAVDEAAAGRSVCRVAARGVGGVLLNADLEAAPFGVVAVRGVVKRVLEEVATELLHGVGSACFQLAKGGVAETLPARRGGSQRRVVVFWFVVSNPRGTGVLAFGQVRFDPWLLAIHAPAPNNRFQPMFRSGMVGALSLACYESLFSPCFKRRKSKIFGIRAVAVCRWLALSLRERRVMSAWVWDLAAVE